MGGLLVPIANMRWFTHDPRFLIPTDSVLTRMPKPQLKLPLMTNQTNMAFMEPLSMDGQLRAAHTSGTNFTRRQWSTSPLKSIDQPPLSCLRCHHHHHRHSHLPVVRLLVLVIRIAITTWTAASITKSSVLRLPSEMVG